MGRRRKRPGAKPPPRLIRHITDPTHENHGAGERRRGHLKTEYDDSMRLTWRHGGFERDYDASDLANIISGNENNGIQWICDSSFSISPPTEQVVWDALLAEKGRLAITPTVVQRDFANGWLTHSQSGDG